MILLMTPRSKIVHAFLLLFHLFMTVFISFIFLWSCDFCVNWFASTSAQTEAADNLWKQTRQLVSPPLHRGGILLAVHCRAILLLPVCPRVRFVQQKKKRLVFGSCAQCCRFYLPGTPWNIRKRTRIMYSKGSLQYADCPIRCCLDSSHCCKDLQQKSFSSTDRDLTEAAAGLLAYWIGVRQGQSIGFSSVSFGLE